MAFDYPTNFSNGTDYIPVDSIGTMIQYSNYVTSGWLGTGFLAIIFIMTFLVSSGSGSKKALLASSFVTFIFSVYLLMLNAVNPVIVFGLIVATIVGALGSKSESNY